MNEKAFAEKFAELISNEEFQNKLTGLKDRNAIQALFAENGLELTDEMLDGIMSKIASYEENGELDEESLDMVAGGGFWKHVTAGAVLGACLGGGKGAIIGAVVGGVAYFVCR